MTELALVVSFFVVFLLFAVEVVLTIGRREKLSTFGREAANIALRDCSPLPDPAPCVAQVRTTILREAAGPLAGLDATLTLYRYDPTTDTVTATQAGGAFTSHYVRANFEAGANSVPELRHLLLGYGTLVTSEMYLPYVPVVQNLGFGTLYEVTLF